MCRTLPLLAPLIFLVPTGCQKESSSLARFGPALLVEAQIGDHRFKNIPIHTYFTPPNPFVRRPLLLLETPGTSPLKIRARFVLRKAKTLAQAAGQTWEMEKEMEILLPHASQLPKSLPLKLSQADLRIEVLQKKPLKMRCLIEGNLISHQGEDLSFSLLLAGPVVLLDGKIR